MKKIIAILIPACIIGIFTVVSLFSAYTESLTYDEVVNIQEGKNAWLHQTYDIELYHPPLAKVLQVAPIVFVENGLHVHLSQIAEKNIGRTVVIIMGVLLLVSVYLVTKKYFGYKQALLALFLLSLEPNTLAVSHVINTDALVNLMIFVSYALLVSLLLKPTRTKAVLFAVSFGLGLASKMSYDSFFTVSALVLLFYVKKWQTFQFLWSKKFYLVFFTFTALLVVWSTYFFHWNVVVKERKDDNRFSARLLQYAQIHHNTPLVTFLTVAEHQKFPLGDFIAIYKNVALAKANPYCFFLGTFYPKCYWYFMPVTYLLKTPIAFTLFSVIGIIALFVIKKKRENYIYFFIPFAVIFIHAALSGAFPLNRYMLPMYPFAAIVGSYSVLFLKSKWKVILAGLLCLWYLGNFFSAYPHYISYTNELAGPKNIQYLHFWDANYDWGQSMPDVAVYAKQYSVGTLYFSYYGRDDGDLYGLKSDKAYGSYKFPDICAFHTIHLSSSPIQKTIISSSNWYSCKYYLLPEYKHPKAVVSDSFLVF